MKTLQTSLKYLAAVLLAGSALSASAATIINVDFNGARDGESVGPTYVGSGAAGGGSTFNGVTANSWTGSANNDNLTVSASGLLSDSGAATSVGLSFSPVLGDDNVSLGNALWRDYLAIQAAGNTSNASFTISGLGAATTADLYFYASLDNGISPFGLSIAITGESPDAFTPVGIFTTSNTLFFDNVAVSIGGTITGVWGSGTTEIMNGLTIDGVPVPEPSTAILLCMGGLAAVLSRRRVA